MYLTETHIIKRSKELYDITFKCKNLYNKANYTIRQEFINNGKYIHKFDLWSMLKDEPEFTCLPTRVSRCVIRTLDANWRGFFNAIKDWKSSHGKYLGKPNLPKYLPKNGKFNAIFIDTGILKPLKKVKGIGLSSLKLRIMTKLKYQDIKEVNVKPLNTGKYKINIVYKYEEKKLKENNGNYCGIDLGLNNLMALTSNKKGLKPLLVNGRPLKSINQFYNKKKAVYQSELPKGIHTSKKISKLTEKRNNKVNDYLYKSSKYLVDWCLKNDINTVILGYNEGWKSGINIGKRNNQNFVGVPYEKLKWIINYKLMKDGLIFKTTEESYTSKCSFLDLEDIKYHDTYKGSRVKRGLFISGSGMGINADINGSYNILRKVVPNLFNKEGIEGFAVNPEAIKCFK